ncbi:hypothetical protein GJ496_002691 [Pomphorhynchus laevis]|nr:hypothetical protein GJ496_002691 [Pomphorhynchus laevis]
MQISSQSEEREDLNNVPNSSRCAPITIQSEETRIWQKKDSKWRCIHTHRSSSRSVVSLTHPNVAINSNLVKNAFENNRYSGVSSGGSGSANKSDLVDTTGTRMLADNTITQTPLVRIHNNDNQQLLSNTDGVDPVSNPSKYYDSSPIATNQENLNLPAVL